MAITSLRNSIARIWPGKRRAGRSKSRAQSMVETAMVLPILMVLLGILVDAGLALNAWLRVNTAARDATRFALDAGRASDINALVLDKMAGVPNNLIDIYIITGKTSNIGLVYPDPPYWIMSHSYGTGPSAPKITADAVQDTLELNGTPGANDNNYFVIVEVDVRYRPLIGELIAPNLMLPMSSYAIIERAKEQ